MNAAGCTPRPFAGKIAVRRNETWPPLFTSTLPPAPAPPSLPLFRLFLLFLLSFTSASLRLFRFSSFFFPSPRHERSRDEFFSNDTVINFPQVTLVPSLPLFVLFSFVLLLLFLFSHSLLFPTVYAPLLFFLSVFIRAGIPRSSFAKASAHFFLPGHDNSTKSFKQSRLGQVASRF